VTSPVAHAQVRTPQSVAHLHLTKTGTLHHTDGHRLGDPGERSGYAFEVVNTGTATRYGVRIDDPIFDGPISCISSTLAPARAGIGL
jgi:hypothetical protein